MKKTVSPVMLKRLEKAYNKLSKAADELNEIVEQIKNDFQNVYIYSNDELLDFGNLGISECFKIQNEKFNKLIKDDEKNAK